MEKTGDAGNEMAECQKLQSESKWNPIMVNAPSPAPITTRAAGPGSNLSDPNEGVRQRDKPTYQDGKPTNLQAAALDALDWLRVVARQPASLRMLRGRILSLSKGVVRSVVQGRPKDPRIKDAVWKENLFRLRLAIEALEEFLPDDESGGGDGST